MKKRILCLFEIFGQGLLFASAGKLCPDTGAVAYSPTDYMPAAFYVNILFLFSSSVSLLSVLDPFKVSFFLIYDLYLPEDRWMADLMVFMDEDRLDGSHLFRFF